MPEKTYNFPVFGTQGGGLVREVSPNKFIFVEKPDCPGLDVGDFMPEEWDYQPANHAAREVLDQEALDGFDLAAELTKIVHMQRGHHFR
ncbi:MAG: hypothetical protein HY507_01000 [Candidatus Zambryskibacteria bacterium]|nr:hypothetical protein [Candidatus Zambryskibacteria bacterium]